MKKNKLRNALLKTLFLLFLVTAGVSYFIFWVMESDDSEFARDAREYIGLPENSGKRAQETSSAEDENSDWVDPFNMPAESEAAGATTIPTITDITFAEVAGRRALWPEVLTLKLDVEISIWYNEVNYGYMKFLRGRTVQVESLYKNGEILCEIDGNYMSLSVYETDFYGWFNEAYGEVYRLLPVTVDFDNQAQKRYSIDTQRGRDEFWAEMREWCYRNYDSPLLSAEEDTLLFQWVPKEKVPIDFTGEAREIARQYLIRRAKYGSRENYAPCEIRNPQMGETLGASSLFIPRL